jgi:putative transposase
MQAWDDRSIFPAFLTPVIHQIFFATVPIVLTPRQAPDVNSYAERWVRTARNEYLDHILIFNQTHLVSVLREFETYYNERRPHQGIDQRTPIMPVSSSPSDGPICCRDVLGGIIHDYYRLAA